MDEKITASFIIEILGRPPEHLKKSLEELVEKLGNEQGVNIIESTVHEPKKFEQKKLDEKGEEMKEKIGKIKNVTVTHEIYTTFANVEAELDDINGLLVVAFNYMPSHIEITHPENFLLKNSDIGAILTNVILRLHRYDEITKRLSVDKSLMEQKLNEVLKEKKD